MIGFVISFIDLLSRVAILVAIAYVFMSYFLDPYHPLRRSLGRIVEPILTPIRRLVPPLGMFDLSPLILIILIQIVSQILIRLIQTLL